MVLVTHVVLRMTEPEYFENNIFAFKMGKMNEKWSNSFLNVYENLVINVFKFDL